MAVDPAPIATTICLNGSVVQSPAANTPGTDVCPRSSITISLRSVSSTAPANHSVFGSSPICTKIPSRSRCSTVSFARITYVNPVTLLPSPSTSVDIAPKITSTFDKLASFVCSTSSARSRTSNSIRVTRSAIPARSIAASTPELPPPITATRLPL